MNQEKRQRAGERNTVRNWAGFLCGVSPGTSRRGNLSEEGGARGPIEKGDHRPYKQGRNFAADPASVTNSLETYGTFLDRNLETGRELRSSPVGCNRRKDEKPFYFETEPPMRTVTVRM